MDLITHLLLQVIGIQAPIIAFGDISDNDELNMLKTVN